METVSGVPMPHCNDPTTIEQCHRNCTIALMGLYRLFENLQVEITADGLWLWDLFYFFLLYLDLVYGNVDKIRALLDTLASDEWVIEVNPPNSPPIRVPFDPTTCDLTYVYNIL